MTAQIPLSLQSDHDDIRATLKRAMREPGATGAAARAVVSLAEQLLRHQRLEEEVIYPAALVVGELIRRIRKEPAALEAA